MKVAMIITPHADDATVFCGGTLIRLAGEGWHIVLVRVTDDRYDSLDLTVDETIRRNTEGLHMAAHTLGVREIVELGFETDGLADLPLGRLRERFVYLFRKHRPHTLFSFDPYGLFEPNQDHIRIAQAVDEALWVSAFDKHYPDHFSSGLSTFSVCERWYYARDISRSDHYEDITATIERKIQAVCATREMVRNTIQQYRLQLRTWGRRLPLLDEAMHGDMQPLVGMFLREQGRAVAARAGWQENGRLGEAFRLERFGAMETLFQELAEPLESGDDA